MWRISLTSKTYKKSRLPEDKRFCTLNPKECFSYPQRYDLPRKASVPALGRNIGGHIVRVSVGATAVTAVDRQLQ
jgi:hypothetical protein